MVELELVAGVMARLGVWWALAGGWAIDGWLGRETREHHDVEVVVRRDDQARVHASLRDDWDLLCIAPPGSGWRRWSEDQLLVPPSFQSKARGSTLEFDIFLESTHGEVWTFRRDSRITRALHEVVVPAKSGVPVVAPEIQLLYMAKSGEAKHEHDFDVARPELGRVAAGWLAGALGLSHPHHPWLARLT